jgi:hypothetical protein
MSDEIIITRNNPSKDPSPQTSYPTERIDLPSKGYFYADNDPLSLGYVDMKMMTAKEEDILTSQNLIKKGVVLDKLLESLIVTVGVNIENLLLCDKNALFVAARRLAYGDSYGPVQIKCQKCYEDAKQVVNLGELREKPYEFEKITKGQNNFEFQLPYSKKVVTFKLLNSKDEVDIDGELKATSKFVKSGGSTEVTTRLKKMITSIDGKTDRSIINKFVDSELLSKDSMALRSHAREISPELDMTFNFTCPSCSHEERMDVPMTVQFFWPES